MKKSIAYIQIKLKSKNYFIPVTGENSKPDTLRPWGHSLIGVFFLTFLKSHSDTHLKNRQLNKCICPCTNKTIFKNGIMLKVQRFLTKKEE